MRGQQGRRQRGKRGRAWDLAQTRAACASCLLAPHLPQMLDACKGVLHLHSNTPPILHRDIKSPNLVRSCCAPCLTLCRPLRRPVLWCSHTHLSWSCYAAVTFSRPAQVTATAQPLHRPSPGPITLPSLCRAILCAQTSCTYNLKSSRVFAAFWPVQLVDKNWCVKLADLNLSK